MELYEVLNHLKIKIKEISHDAAYTVNDIKSLNLNISGIGSKNLFLTDKKGKYILVVIEDDKNANLKDLENITNINHLSFASKKDLNEILHVMPGCVTPMGIINDADNKILLLIDKDFVGKKILVHPNINTKTISIDYKDLIKFIEYENHVYILF